MTNSFDWFYPPVVIMSEHLALKFRSYILILNSVTNLSKLSIIESRDAGWEPPSWLWDMVYRPHWKVIYTNIPKYMFSKVTNLRLYKTCNTRLILHYQSYRHGHWVANNETWWQLVYIFWVCILLCRHPAPGCITSFRTQLLHNII